MSKMWGGEELLPFRVKCKCGTTVYFQIQTDRVICRYCGHWVYRTPKLEFIYKMKENMKKKSVEEIYCEL